jgi:hypothetical protein
MSPEQPSNPTPAIAEAPVASRGEVAQPAQTSAPSPSSEKEHKRTAGMWITDTIVYPLVTNPAVAILSVAATYLTEKGGDKTQVKQLVNGVEELVEKPTYGWIGEQMAKRGQWLDKQFIKLNMTPKQAQMGRFVTFSFLDGSLLEPITSSLEDKRNDISKSIDNTLGTQPKDSSAYDEEPKRSDGSLLAGRAATVAVVVPTAVYLGKSRGKDANGVEKPSFNDKLFNNPGLEIGGKVDEILAKGIEHNKPSTFGEKMTHSAAKFAQGLDKLTGKTLDKPVLFKTLIFEAFYTTVCTTGLYFSSKLFAHSNKDEKKDAQPHALKQAAPTDNHAASPSEAAYNTSAKPTTTIRSRSNDKDSAELSPLLLSSAPPHAMHI